MGKCKCRISALEKQDGFGFKSKHVVEDLNLFCKICNKTIKKYSNHPSDDYYGNSYECMKCRSYILYTSDTNKLWKEEFYFDDLNIMMINEEDDDETLLWKISDDKKILSLPRIKFTDKNKIRDKLKTYIIFS